MTSTCCAKTALPSCSVQSSCSSIILKTRAKGSSQAWRRENRSTQRHSIRRASRRGVRDDRGSNEKTQRDLGRIEAITEELDHPCDGEESRPRANEGVAPQVVEIIVQLILLPSCRIAA
jgi:hypothetical protein